MVNIIFMQSVIIYRGVHLKTITAYLFSIVLLFLAMLQGCSSGADSALVAIQKVNDLYYRVDINMVAASHYEIGKQYALQIKNTVPDYESLIDSSIKVTIDLLKQYDQDIDFNTLNTRAHSIVGNIPTDYQQEIQGMQSVFSSTDDTVGNGQLSQNKLLVYELAPDVARAISCSASAAFGSGTATGKTILGRNLEWNDDTRPFLSALHSVVMLHNGNNSIVLFGFIGQLYVISGFNTSKVFVSTLDSDVGIPYMLDGDERSYVMDLRYALENQTTLKGVADYLTGKPYAYDFNIFMADENSSAVFEDDIHNAFSGLRTATSTLKTDTETPILPWNFSNAITCVNWFTLPGTIDNSSLWDGNAARWNTFSTLYTNAFANGGKLSMDTMKQITSYPGPQSDGKGTNGAIWRYNDADSEMQSIIMDMNTLETWISFQPAGAPPLQSPNYIQVFSRSPF